MANMSYCRFQNTLLELQDCQEHLFDNDLSQEESEARLRLLDLCKYILDNQEAYFDSSSDVPDFDDYDQGQYDDPNSYDGTYSED